MGTLLERGAGLGIKAESVSPGLVSAHLGLKAPESAKRYKDKKELGVSVVSEWIDNGRVECPSKWSTMFKTAAKKDDLADSMMIGVAYVDWMAATQLYIHCNAK